MDSRSSSSPRLSRAAVGSQPVVVAAAVQRRHQRIGALACLAFLEQLAAAEARMEQQWRTTHSCLGCRAACPAARVREK